MKASKSINLFAPKVLLIAIVMLAFGGCKKEIIINQGQGLADWTVATHSNDVSGNYSVVFDQNKVHRLDIVIDEDGHALLTDFGLSKEGINDHKSAVSFCGSLAYLAPEMLKR